MALTAQDKMIYVANKLGLSTLENMQGSTRVVYDSYTTPALTHTFFKNAAQNPFPLSNVGANGNKFQVNEALLVEQIAFFLPKNPNDSPTLGEYDGLGSESISVLFDLVIGNKTVLKDNSCEFRGTQAFYNDGGSGSSVLYLEGAGILIPPQVEYTVIAKTFNNKTRVATTARLGCYLFGTAALLNFNTTI